MKKQIQKPLYTPKQGQYLAFIYYYSMFKFLSLENQQKTQ